MIPKVWLCVYILFISVFAIGQEISKANTIHPYSTTTQLDQENFSNQLRSSHTKALNKNLVNPDSNMTLLHRWETGICRQVNVNRNILIHQIGSLIVLKPAGISDLHFRYSRFDTDGIILDTDTDDDAIVVALDIAGVKIIDISNLQQPFETASIPVAAGFTRSSLVLYENSLLIIIDKNFNESILKIYDLSEISNPRMVGQFNSSFDITSISKFDSKDIILLGHKGSIIVLDITDLSNPVELSYSSSDRAYGNIKNITLHNSHALIATDFGNLRIVNFVDPTNPYEVATIDSLPAIDSAVKNNIAYVTTATPTTNRTFVKVFDLSDIANPKFLTSFSSEMAFEEPFKELAIYENTLYVAVDNGLKAIDITLPENPTEIDYLYTAAGSNAITDFVVRGSLVYLIKNREFFILEIGDSPIIPLNSVYTDRNSRFSAIILEDNYAIVCDTDFGLKVFDISNSDSILLVSSLQLDIRFQIARKGNYIFAGKSHGLSSINIANPLQPFVEGEYTFQDPNFNESGLRIYDRYLFATLNHFQWGSNQIRIFDLINPANLQLLATIRGRHPCVVNNYAYIAEVYDYNCYNVSNPSSPRFITTIANNISVRYSDAEYPYLFYSDFFKIRMLDISNPISPVEVGHYNEIGSAQLRVNNGIIYSTSNGTGYSRNQTRRFLVIRNDLFSQVDTPSTLHQKTLQHFKNYPNPFNNETVIEYQIDKSAKISLNIYNVQGQLIEKLVDKWESPGHKRITWKPINYSSGIYFIHLNSDSFSHMIKSLLVK